ncbi:CDC45-like protein [Saccharata proteae CBS 121410]|uniref:CDC45-like protein n=1 Tax=Saccharata proteae CBS 121410 TaxID=1314787 RepID=A0A9P4M1Q0_9PEZI|nr:CDC45-like protein [Saccharata proteae CBS 121410]
MYLPRGLISHLYTHLLHTTHPLSPPVLLLVSLEPDALCACRILTALLKRDYIPHKIQPISGYNDLARAGQELVRPMRTTDGGSGGVVICLGVGGLVDLESILGLEEEGGAGFGEVDIWVIDARRPWNLSNVFGGRGDSIPDETGAPRKLAGVMEGKLSRTYKPGQGGIIVFDDGDIEEELGREKEAYTALEDMPEFDDEELEDLDDDSEEEHDDETVEDDAVPTSGQNSGKRKNRDEDESDLEDEERRPAQRRRSNSVRDSRTVSDSISRSESPTTAPVQTKQPSARTLRRRLVRLRARHNKVLDEYYSLGTSYSEPVSSIVYSLASELGREDNDLLWQAIVGVSSLELYGRTPTGLSLSTSHANQGWNGNRGDRIRAILRDEVRRLNPSDLKDLAREASLGESGGVIPTNARSPTDNAIRLSPEPRFLLIRHWSLYDSMLHSPYLSAKLHIWSDTGRRRLHKLLAKMGVSLSQSKQNYTHMDMELKRGLRERLLKFAPVYGLDGLVPEDSSRGSGKEGWGFVRCWGWKACLSAIDVCVILGAILEVGDAATKHGIPGLHDMQLPPTPQSLDGGNGGGGAADEHERVQEEITSRFWTAYDALSSPSMLTTHITTAQHLHRAILRTGTALIAKHQIRHLRAFRMAVVKEGPDVALFTHPGALVKLALWVAEAIAEMEGKKGRAKGNELVMAGLDEARGVKEREKRREEKRKERERKKEAKREEKRQKKQKEVERRLANGEDVESEDEDDEEDEDTEEEASDDSDSEGEDDARDAGRKGKGRNRFGIAFQEVIEETGARVKVDSFENCVVEVKKEDLSGFLEALSLKAIVG